MPEDMEKKRGQNRNAGSAADIAAPVVRKVERCELNNCLDVIHRSFRTIAERFGITEENCPRHTAFLLLSRLENNMDSGWHMFGVFVGKKIVGYASLSDEGGGVFELHNISVLPEYRHNGFGRMLIEHAKKAVTASGASKLLLSFIDENSLLKAWYISNGFEYTGAKKFDHLPFTSGYMEWKAGKEKKKKADRRASPLFK